VTREREPLPTRVEDTPDLPADYAAALERGLEALGIDLPDTARAAIDGHIRLLAAWTTAINLTAIRDPASMALQHVVDSLTALPWLADRPPARLLDLGSGGGFPGLPLAAVLRATSTTLLEPIAKKARFLAVVAAATGLDGRVDVRTARAEAMAGAPGAPGAPGSWSAVTARAVAPLAELVELAFPLLEPGGRLIAWKRGDLAEEATAAGRAITTLGGGDLELRDVPVPTLVGHRLAIVTRTGTVPAGYPRDPAARRRRPW
jgi:16S rRNA (guanine527-N7)-methyltransferase